MSTSKDKNIDGEKESKKNIEDRKVNKKINEEKGSKNKEETLESKVSRLESEVKTEKDRFLRLFAEFENYKKRTTKERIELFKTAGEEVIVSLLPVLDDFDRSVEQLIKLENEEFLEGVQLIQKKFFNTLKDKGLEILELEQGAIFDAETHEAITQIPAPNESMKGKIIDVVEKGYILSDKLIRYPKVVVGK